jgi:hypothetical protein
LAYPRQSRAWIFPTPALLQESKIVVRSSFRWSGKTELTPKGLPKCAALIFADVSFALALIGSTDVAGDVSDSAVFMRHLLCFRRWLELLDDDLAQSPQRALSILFQQSRPKLVQA